MGRSCRSGRICSSSKNPRGFRANSLRSSRYHVCNLHVACLLYGVVYFQAWSPHIPHLEYLFYQCRSRSTAVTLAYVATLLSSPLWGDALTTDGDAPFALAVKSKSTSIGSVPPPVSPVPGSNHQQPTNDGDCGSLPHEANSLIDIASQLVKVSLPL